MDDKPHSDPKHITSKANTPNASLLITTKKIVHPAAVKIYENCEIWSKDFCPCFQKILVNELTTLLERLVDNFAQQHVDKEKQKLIKDIKESSDEIEWLKKRLNENIEVENFESLCLCQQAEEMKKEVNFYKRQMWMRKGELESLKKQADELKDDLGMSETKFDTLGDAVSAVEMSWLRGYVWQLENKRFIKERKIAKCLMDLEELYESISPVEGFDVEILERKDLKPTENNEKMLSSLWTMLKNVEKKRKKIIGNLMQQLTDLWFRLDVPEAHQDNVKSDLRPNPSTIERLESEISRCRKIEKRQNELPERIEVLRVEITEWLKKSKVVTYGPWYYDAFEYREEVLEGYKRKLRRLKEYYEENKPIFGFLDERQSLRSKLEALKKKQDDARSRMKDLSDQEQQEIISIEDQLLKIEMNLFYAVVKFEKKHSRPFLVEGKEIQIDNIGSLMYSNNHERKPLGNISNV